MNTEILVQQLIEQLRKIIDQVEKLKRENIQDLSWKSNPTAWSILECLAHLNLYGDFYLPEIESINLTAI